MVHSPSKQLPYQSVLERRPRYTKAIGLISIELGNMDIVFADLLSALLSVHVIFGRAVYMTPRTEIGRLQMISNLVDAMLLKDSAGRKKVEKLVKRAMGLVTTRHNQIHSVWGLINNRVHRRSIPLLDSRPPERVKLETLTNYLRDVRVLIEDVLDVTEQVRASEQLAALHGKQPRPNPPQTEETHTQRTIPLVVQQRPRRASLT